MIYSNKEKTTNTFLNMNSVLEAKYPAEFIYNYAQKHGRLNKEWEKLFLSIGDVFPIYKYARDIIKGRWEECEDVLFANAEWLIYYAINVLNDKLPQKLENKVFCDKWCGETYNQFCNYLNKRKHSEKHNLKNNEISF